MRRIARAAPVALFLIITSCTTYLWEPVEVAQTDEQRAFALFATAGALIGTAADVAEDPATPDAVKSAIKSLAPVVGNASFILRDAARAYVAIKARFDGGEPGVQLADVTAALQVMLDAIKNAKPTIEALATAIK